MTWRFTSQTPRAVTPRTTRPGQRAKGYILLHTSPLSSIYLNLLPAPLFFFPLLRLCLCCVTAGCFFDGSLKENRKEKWRQLTKHRDIPLNTRLRNLYFYVRCSAEAFEEKCELLMKLHIHTALFEKRIHAKRRARLLVVYCYSLWEKKH